MAFFPRLDDEITASDVSLSEYDGKYLGVLPISEARMLAREKELALIEITLDLQPPSCRLVPRWMVERVKHHFRGPWDPLSPDLPDGVAYLEFDEDGWSTRSMYVSGGHYFSSRGLGPMDKHPVLGEGMLGDQPLWKANMDVPGVSPISSDEFEAVWRAAGSA